ncbi:MAG TPA: membrane protein insertase YidC [Sphingobacteriaceae bacterium]|nr:membrane protein insertase YidC [Sphingobacteriaceae bacterium]
MDRNTFTGLFLILVILVGSTYLMQPSKEELKKEKFVQDSIARSKNPSVKTKPLITPEKSNVAPVIDTALLKGPFGAARVGNDQSVILQNELLKIQISPKGGRISRVELKTFKTYDQKPLILFTPEESKFGFALPLQGSTINTSDLYFTPSAPSLNVSKSNSGSVTMRLSYSAGQFIDYTYTLNKGSYKVAFAVTTKGLANVVASGQKHLTLNWGATFRKKEKDITSERNYSTAYYKALDGDVDHISVSENENKDLSEGKVQWVAFKQHFFSSILVSKAGFDKATVAVKMETEADKVKSYAATMQIPFNGQDTTYPMEFYFGPNQYKTLKVQGYDLELLIDMGYWPLQYINRYIVLPVFNFLERFNWSYGLIILVLTILLKMVLLPLTYKSYLSMAKMRILKPEMEEIKAKVGDDNPTLLQQEYMKLYKKAGVNPLGGCIPMLLQLPIIMAFFFFFPNLFELRQQSFLWMQDLSTFDDVIRFAKIPLIGIDHISLMCILMTISTLIYTYFNNQISGATGQMKYIGYITPIIFLGVLNSYPSGLNYYYFLANMLTFAQQYAIRQFVNDDKIHAKIQENKKKPGADKKSKFQQRMEDYMRNQQGKTKEPVKKLEEAKTSSAKKTVSKTSGKKK